MLLHVDIRQAAMYYRMRASVISDEADFCDEQIGRARAVL